MSLPPPAPNTRFTGTYYTYILHYANVNLTAVVTLLTYRAIRLHTLQVGLLSL